MKVIVCETPYKLSVINTEIPEMQNDDVLVKIKYCGICSYDLKRFLGLKDITYPLILGHEPSGQVEKIGKDVREIKKGDRVVVDVKVKCGECPSCLRGMESRCPQTEASLGFSQYLLVPQENVFKLSSDIDLKVATLTEPLACILHGYSKIKLRSKSSLLIAGDGIMGMLSSLVGKVIEKSAVILLGHNKNRLKVAQSIDVECVLSTKNSLPLSNPFDTIIFTVEEKRIINNLKKYLSPGGNLLFIGELKNGSYRLNLNSIYSNEYAFIGSKGYTREDFTNALSVIEKCHGVLERFISKIYQIDELERGFRDLQKRKILKGILCLDN